MHGSEAGALTYINAQRIPVWEVDAMTQWIRIDVRGLEPPMPMVRILEKIASLPSETGVIARTDRQPFLLLEELPRRGFAGKCNPAPDGEGYVTTIQSI